MYEFYVNKLNLKKNYTIISNEMLKDKNVSSNAKFLLCLILSLPHNWDFSINGLVACIKEGKSALYSMLKELEKNKYLIITHTKKQGKFHSKYEFFEAPFDEYHALNKKAKHKLRSRTYVTEKRPQINTNKINIENNKTNYRIDSEIISNIQTKINYNMLVEKYEQYDIDKIVMVIAHTISSDETDETTQNTFNNLTAYHVEYTLEKAKVNSKRIKNYDAWVKKVLSNIPPKETIRIRETDFTKHVESEEGW